MTETEVVELLAVAQALWPSLRLPTSESAYDMLTGVWHRQLADLDQPVVLAVLEAASSGGGEFAPTPGSLRRQVVAAMAVAGGAPEADEAWQQVKAEIARVGWSHELAPVGGAREYPRPGPTFTHPAIVAVVTAMGWSELCTGENEVADRAHFMRLYRDRVERGERDQAVPPHAREVLAAAAPALEAGLPVAQPGIQIPESGFRNADDVLIPAPPGFLEAMRRATKKVEEPAESHETVVEDDEPEAGDGS